VLSWHDAQLLKYCATPALSDCGAAKTRHTIAEVNMRSPASRLMVFMVRKIISSFQDSSGVNIRVMVKACLDFKERNCILLRFAGAAIGAVNELDQQMKRELPS